MKKIVYYKTYLFKVQNVDYFVVCACRHTKILEKELELFGCFINSINSVYNKSNKIKTKIIL